MKIKLLSLIGILSLSTQIQSQTWEAIEDMPLGKHHPVTFAIDGYGYAATGWDQNVGPSNDVYKYDPVADSWSTISDFPGAWRSFGIGFDYKGKGYLGFGATSNSYLGDIYEFDPSSETWELVTICPCQPRRHPAFLIKDDNIYIGMGDGAQGDLNDWWRYDMIADEWEEMPSIPGPNRHHPFQFVVNNELYAGMGHGGPIIYDDWYHFDTDNETWETLNDFTGEARVAGTQFSHGEYGYVLSGDGSDHSYMAEGEFWQYDPTMDEWNQMTSHPGISIWAPGSFVIGDTIYFIGGQNRQTGVIQSDAWKFVLPTPTPPLGFSDGAINNDFVIWPNPTNNVLNLKADFEIAQVSIQSLSGQVVYSAAYTNNPITVSSLPPGVYITQITDITGKQYTASWVKN
jgi:N-acetylneuraminic acid mutarotase